jgi:hypothetical protein
MSLGSSALGGVTLARVEAYAYKYQRIRMHRRHGILSSTFHMQGGRLKEGEVPSWEVGHACVDIGSDPENTVW